ncbi:MAG: 4Fe-4S binding protein [Oscillospiraceae bacterium]|nr:4Fe-4S binding protein [Oscillospiraceae bacterium]
MSDNEKKINSDALERRAKAKKPLRKAKVIIDPKFCKGCGLCIYSCPAGVLQFFEAPNNRWGVAVKVDEPDYCAGCLRCEMLCPDFAIFSYKSTVMDSVSV